MASNYDGWLYFLNLLGFHLQFNNFCLTFATYRSCWTQTSSLPEPAFQCCIQTTTYMTQCHWRNQNFSFCKVTAVVSAFTSSPFLNLGCCLIALTWLPVRSLPPYCLPYMFWVTLILWSWFLVCSTFAIFVLHLMDDMHVSLTGPIHLQGLLIRGVERNRGRNAVYSLHSFVGTWLFWTLVTDTQRRDATLTAVSCQTRPTCFPSKLQEKLVSIHTYVRLPSFVCAFVICRSQSPDRSFSFSMINLFRSFSVMCGPSKITVSELRLDANL